MAKPRFLNIAECATQCIPIYIMMPISYPDAIPSPALLRLGENNDSFCKPCLAAIFTTLPEDGDCSLTGEIGLFATVFE